MVFLVDHNAHPFVGDKHRDAARFIEPAFACGEFALGVLAGHQLAFDEQVAIIASNFVQVDPHELRRVVSAHVENALLACFEDLCAIEP